MSEITIQEAEQNVKEAENKYNEAVKNFIERVKLPGDSVRALLNMKWYIDHEYKKILVNAWRAYYEAVTLRNEILVRSYKEFKEKGRG